MPKGEWATELIEKISRENGGIVLSDNNILELEGVGYSRYDIESLLSSLRCIHYVESTDKEVGIALDLSKRRDIPKRDALHALIARDNRAILVTLDNHFTRVADIITPHSPKTLI